MQRAASWLLLARSLWELSDNERALALTKRAISILEHVAAPHRK